MSKPGEKSDMCDGTETKTPGEKDVETGGGRGAKSESERA